MGSSIAISRGATFRKKEVGGFGSFWEMFDAIAVSSITRKTVFALPHTNLLINGTKRRKDIQAAKALRYTL
jgi:hypothetical protein